MGKHATHPARPHARRAAPAGLSLLAVLVTYAAVTTPPRDAGEPGQAGSRPASDPVPEGDPSTEGRVVLITGSTSGLGREVARRLARSGDHVIVHGRDVDRGTALVEEIERETDGGARFYRADFASLDQIREFSEAILRDYDRLDVLVNNAGIWLESADGRRVSQDGHELHFQVNYLAGYLLTDMLLPLLRKSAPSRIVNVSSGAQRPIDFGDVMLEERYDPGRGYAQSKLAQVMFTFALAEELEGTGITVNALHPATMMNTNMVLSRGARPRSDVEEGVEAVLHLVDAPAVGSGGYFDGTRPARANGQAYDEAARDRLMRLSQELTAG